MNNENLRALIKKKKNIFKELDQLRGSAMPVLGKYLGYPSCCINDFMKNFGRKKVISRKMSGTGYIPCVNCNKKTEKELLLEINNKRICPTAFPNDLDKIDMSNIGQTNLLSITEKNLLIEWEKKGNILKEILEAINEKKKIETKHYLLFFIKKIFKNKKGRSQYEK